MGMFGLLGPNGAGKTTLMRVLATLLQPTSGAAYVGDWKVDDRNQKWKIRAQLGYLPQEIQMYDNLSAREFLAFVAALKRIPTEERGQQIGKMLELTGLSDAAGRKIRAYSGGMKRRLGVAQALIGNPKVLIVDEPTAGLDPQERVRFRNLLVELARERLVLLSSHITEDVAPDLLASCSARPRAAALSRQYPDVAADDGGARLGIYDGGSRCAGARRFAGGCHHPHGAGHTLSSSGRRKTHSGCGPGFPDCGGRLPLAHPTAQHVIPDRLPRTPVFAR